MKHRWPTGSKMSGIWLPSAKVKHRFFHTTEYALPACSGITHRIGERSQMYDIHVILSNTPGLLGAMGMALAYSPRLMPDMRIFWWKTVRKPAGY